MQGAGHLSGPFFLGPRSDPMKSKRASASAPGAPALPRPGRALLARLFALDPRTLAAFRLAAGAVLLLDLAIRFSDLAAMYGDEGMFPRDQIRLRYTSAWNWSFHFAGGSTEFQTALFALAALFGLALLAGFQTRWATIGSWLLLVSIQHRVPPILNAGDGLLRLLLFWGMFLPLGQAWSVDAWRRRRAHPSLTPDRSPVLSVASAAIQLQMALMYFLSAIFKSTPDWFRGQVIAGSLAHDIYAKPPGEWALQFPALLTAMTFGVFVLEWAGPLLLFLPWWTGRVRLAVIGALAAMHLGIEACLTVGLFSLISLAGLTLFLPAEIWPRHGSDAPVASAPPVAGRRSHWLREGLCAALLLYVLGLNVAGVVSHARGQPSTAGWKPLNSGLGLGQKWGMFDETPSKDGWYVARGWRPDGSQIDLLQDGAPVSWDRPDYPTRMFPNHRWRKLFREMTYFDDFGYQVFREPAARYLRRAWNARNAATNQVGEFELVFCMVQTNGPPGAPPARERIVRIPK